MKKYPEVIAVLVLALGLSILSKATEVHTQSNRVMVLTTTEPAEFECPLQELRSLPSELRQEFQTNVRDSVREQLRSTAAEITTALKSVQ
jgi:hypothetical protein